MSVTLIRVSDRELIERLEKMVSQERALTHEIVLHFAEVDRRRLYAEKGYTSLYDYATRGLKYSGSSATRRIRASRILKDCPEIYACLQDARLSLSVLEVIPDTLAGEKLRKVLCELHGKSKDEARRVLACYCPVDESRVCEKITPVVIKPKSQEFGLFTTAADVLTEEVMNDDYELEQELRYQISSLPGKNFTR